MFPPGDFATGPAAPDPVSWLRAAAGSLLLFVVPGLAWSFVAFRRLRPLERAVLSVGLSIAVVTLTMLVANLILGMRLSGLNAVIVTLGATAVAGVWLLVRFELERAKKRPSDGPGRGAPGV